jgi:hypothetical protein
MMIRMQRFIILGAAGLLACSEQTPTELRVIDPTTLRMDVVSGNDQRGPAGTELPAPLVVRVRNSTGGPLAGRMVTFVVLTGGGSVYGGSSISDAQGYARDWWTLGNTGGTNTLEVRAVDSSTGEKRSYALFTAVGEGAGAAPVATVTVSPSTAALTVGGTVTLSATLRDSGGNVLTGRTVTWSSSNTTAATVSASGVVTGRAAGSAVITASSEGRSGTASISVTAMGTDTIPPPAPGWPTLTTAVVSADTFSVTATWTASSGAASYEWNTGANSSSWTRSGSVTTNTVTFRVPAAAGSGYWFCVRALDAAQNRSQYSCGPYSRPGG